MVVRLVDVNDNSPRLEQRLWEVEMNETWGTGPPEDVSLLEISVMDPDTSNYFFYRASIDDLITHTKVQMHFQVHSITRDAFLTRQYEYVSWVYFENKHLLQRMTINDLL